MRSRSRDIMLCREGVNYMTSIKDLWNELMGTLWGIIRVFGVIALLLIINVIQLVAYTYLFPVVPELTRAVTAAVGTGCIGAYLIDKMGE